jgi:hypothetical protein
MVVGLAAAVTSLGAVITGAAVSSTERVSLPPRDASPVAVVRAYVAALNAEDGRTVQILREGPVAESWLGNGNRISDLHVTGVFEEKPQWSGLPPEARVVSVGVRFNLDRTIWSSFVDPSMEEGLTVWGYQLTQDSASGRWMIFNQGTG